MPETFDFNQHNQQWRRIRLKADAIDDVDFTAAANAAAAAALPWIGIPKHDAMGHEVERLALYIVAETAANAPLDRGSCAFEVVLLEEIQRADLFGIERATRYIDSVPISTNVTLDRKIFATVRGNGRFTVAMQNLSAVPATTDHFSIYARIE